MANGTSKNVVLGKFWQDLEISEAFLISLEVSFLHGLFLLCLSRNFLPKSLRLGRPFLTKVTRWSRSMPTFYALIGHNLTGEFMRKIYAAS